MTAPDPRKETPMTDMNAIIRRAAGIQEPEQQPAEPPSPDLDGGARTPAPPAPPSMDERLRAAVLSRTADLPMDQALRQVRFEQNLKEN